MKDQLCYVALDAEDYPSSSSHSSSSSSSSSLKKSCELPDGQVITIDTVKAGQDYGKPRRASRVWANCKALLNPAIRQLTPAARSGQLRVGLRFLRRQESRRCQIQ